MTGQGVNWRRNTTKMATKKASEEADNYSVDSLSFTYHTFLIQFTLEFTSDTLVNI
jgi:hypothetical protein